MVPSPLLTEVRVDCKQSRIFVEPISQSVDERHRTKPLFCRTPCTGGKSPSRSRCPVMLALVKYQTDINQEPNDSTPGPLIEIELYKRIVSFYRLKWNDLT